MAGSGKKLCCKVILLDDGTQTHHIQRRAFGGELLSLVCGDLKLIETDYFGLEYITKSHNAEWLDKDKSILSQTSMSSSAREVTFKFKVKFYTSEPTLLEHDLTRYFFALQIKQDLVTGQLACNENTAAILSSYIVQSELGDFYYQANDHDYLKSIKLVPKQTDELEDKIAEYHKALRGLNVVEAEFQLLDVARKTEMYGIIPHSCQNSDGLAIQLAVTHSGIHGLINGIKSVSYIWVKIRKLGFKRKRFLLKLYPIAKSKAADNVVEYLFPSRDAAKAFWKLSVEHHSFFKKLEVAPTRKSRHTLLSRGSSFRYNGRTQTQLLDEMRQQWGQSTFDRSMSLRNFPSTSLTSRFGKSATFHSRQELGVMTLDRVRGAKLMVPSASRVTLESRYSGSYETTPQPADGTAPLGASHSLSVISGLTKSTGRFDLKSSSTFLPKQEDDRDSNRDSIAVVEDNRAELERLVEQINSDLTSAQLAKASSRNSGDELEKVDTSSSIERFLSTTAQPFIPPERLQPQEMTQLPAQQVHHPPTQQPNISVPICKVEQQQSQNQQQLADQPKEQQGAEEQPKQSGAQQTEYKQTVAVESCGGRPLSSVVSDPQGATAAYIISDDETLQILLTENVKDSPVTDLDLELSTDVVDGLGTHAAPLADELSAADATVNDVLDSLGTLGSGTLTLVVDEESQMPSIPEDPEIEKVSGLDFANKIEHISTDVVVLSSPDSEDEDLVFRSRLEISMPPATRRARVRSRQEEMNDLHGLSQLAEKVLRGSKEKVKQQSQELSDLATQVLDFCADTGKEEETQVSDLSELLAHYDAIKEQQEALNERALQLKRAQFRNGSLANDPIVSNGTGQLNGHLQQDVLPQPPPERTKRKPLIRPALPVLAVSKERLLDWNTDSYKSDWIKPETGGRYDLHITDCAGLADSGIEVIGLSRGVQAKSDQLGDQCRQSSSDGYSSEGEDVHTATAPRVICNPTAR